MEKIQKLPASPKLPLVNISNKQRDLKLSKPRIKKAVLALCSYLSINCDELSFYFVSKKEITSLHEKFFDDPTPTDCITFPIDDSYLGDVFCAPSAAIAFAPENPYPELLLYIIHGMLHLIGYDDMNPKDKRIMRKKEKQCMEFLRKNNTSL